MRSNYTRDILIFSFLLVFCALFGHSETFGPYTITSSQCVTVGVDNRATVVMQVSGGSWTGTIQPKGTIDGQTAVNVQIVPAASTTTQTTITANGAYVVSVAGYSKFQLCGATVTNTATIYLSTSPFVH